MRIVHQFAPPMSALLAQLPGVTAAEHVPADARWALPTDADVLFVLHGEGEDRAAALAAPRPAGWPGKVRLVQLASAGADDYPPWMFEAPLVASASGTTAIPIAEYALAAMLSHAKRLPEITLKAGDAWPSRDMLMGKPLASLNGRTLGLIGLGNIARQVGKFANAFGMRIIACRASDAPSPDPWITVAPLDEVIAQADHLVIAAPIGASTQDLLDGARLGRMKRDAHIVNIARGGIIDQEALLAEFARDRLWASLDVTDPEPLPTGHPLIGHPRARITPHLSWSDPDINRRVLERLAENIRRMDASEPLLGAIG
ncbi:NAD(P)-dependent oxidoreductase [Sandarakinorhabdus sp.]|uniref:NAD(P)-dependent oxidoreductase n=1 Tax=Sandarakinorhabdus sp. TaxID=1916663 RepID=UPI00286E0ABE|nr:NAD(P)-dependent oxidoreductase [Sandarakinorhabdus sp.]